MHKVVGGNRKPERVNAQIYNKPSTRYHIHSESTTEDEKTPSTPTTPEEVLMHHNSQFKAQSIQANTQSIAIKKSKKDKKKNKKDNARREDSVKKDDVYELLHKVWDMHMNQGEKPVVYTPNSNGQESKLFDLDEWYRKRLINEIDLPFS